MADPFEPSTATSDNIDDLKLHRWAVWAIPPDSICKRVKMVMDILRKEFGGPEIEPHMAVAGSTLFSHTDVIEKSYNACGEVSPYGCQVDRLETSKFYFQCVYLVFKNGDEFDETRRLAGIMNCRCDKMPYLSLLYGDLTDEEKKRAVEIVKSVDEGLCSISFTITRVQLYKVNLEDRTQKSWEKVHECNLRPH